MKRTFAKKSLATLLSVLVSFSFMEMLFSQNTFALEKKLDGTVYIFREKDKFDEKKARDHYSTVDYYGENKPFGKLYYSGNFKDLPDKNGIKALCVEEGKIKLRYDFNISYYKNDYNNEEWHLYMSDNAKKVNGVELDGKNKSGAIIVQSSFDGKNWCTDEVFLDAFSKKKESSTDIYETNEIQVISGCYYKITVAYKAEKKYDSYKIKDFEIIDKKTYKRVEEIYEFYAESKDKDAFSEINSHSNQVQYYSDFVYTDEYYCELEDDVDIKDPHYGKKIGQFAVKGYTSVNKDDQDCFKYIKTGTDRIAISFELEERNLDKLFGNEKYKLNYDRDATDKNIETPIMDFKQGTVIISFIDTSNMKHEKIYYTNFLAACTTTKANTAVYLFEEGKYEVTLDYEILNIKKTPDKKTNYRMSFKFEVVNGNAEVFIKDSVNGSFLSNEAVTENGFVLDYANSKKLNVNCQYFKYSMVNNQLTETAGKNSVAADGDEFSNSGKYVITVSSDSGTESSTYVIYIGKDKYTLAVTQPNMDLEKVNEKLAQGYKIKDDGTLYK